MVDLKTRLVTEEMLQNLPEPVKRYMKYSGVAGKPWIETVRVKQVGRIRRGVDQGWMALSAEQFYTTDPPGFLWKARIKVAGLPLMSARDSYKGGKGHMLGKVAGVFTLFDARGEEMNQGSMVRYLSEMIWFPTAFLGENITWQGIDDHSAQITFTDGGRSISARMVFDDQGRPVDFIAQRYYESNGKFSLETWSATCAEFEMRAGLNLPVRGKAAWKLSSGDLPYIDLEITEVEFNGAIEPF
jgi:hypothetical protein